MNLIKFYFIHTIQKFRFFLRSHRVSVGIDQELGGRKALNQSKIKLCCLIAILQFEISTMILGGK